MQQAEPAPTARSHPKQAATREAGRRYRGLRHADSPSGDVAILWIDDRPDTGLFRFLALDGFRITSVETGTAGLERAHADPYDLIVLDLHLPDVHGLTVLQRLRTHGISTPVLVVTGHYLDRETETHARAADATAFKYKPLWADEAAQLLRGVVGMNGSGGASVTSAAIGSTAPTRSDPSLDGSAAGEIAIARLLATLDGLALTRDEPRDEALSGDALLGALLAALADPSLPLAGFRVCADAVRAAVHAASSDDRAAHAATTRDLLREAARRPLTARQSVARKVLSLLLAKPRWWREDDLAMEVAASPTRIGRSVSGDLGVEYRTLRRLVVMKAGMMDVVTTDDQFAQIAHRLGMHPGTFDAVFDETFGICPRLLRRLSKRLHP